MRVEQRKLLMVRVEQVDYDWSNAKKTWVDQSPMDCDGMLVQQAARNKAQNPSAKVFVRRGAHRAVPQTSASTNTLRLHVHRLRRCIGT